MCHWEDSGPGGGGETSRLGGGRDGIHLVEKLWVLSELVVEEGGKEENTTRGFGMLCWAGLTGRWHRDTAASVSLYGEVDGKEGVMKVRLVK